MGPKKFSESAHMSKSKNTTQIIETTVGMIPCFVTPLHLAQNIVKFSYILAKLHFKLWLVYLWCQGWWWWWWVKKPCLPVDSGWVSKLATNTWKSGFHRRFLLKRRALHILATHERAECSVDQISPMSDNPIVAHHSPSHSHDHCHRWCSALRSASTVTKSSRNAVHSIICVQAQCSVHMGIWVEALCLW